MKCILHIGTEKTGTTSLQKFYEKHRDVLLERGLWYPRSLGGHWHRKLSVYAMPASRPDDAFEALGISGPEKHAAFKKKLENDFSEEIRSVGEFEYCLISSEHFHSRLKNVDEVMAVKEFLSSYFDDFTVVVHLRPQVEVLVSLASTVARGRRIVDSYFFESADMESSYYNYDALLSIWGDVFGKDNIKPVSFKKQPNMVGYISSLIGVDCDDLGEPGRENSSLDVEVVALLNSVKRSGVDVRGFVAAINDLPVRNKILLSRVFAQEIQSRCDANNRKLSEAFPEMDLNDLVPDYSKYSEEGNVDILDAKCDFSNALADFFSRSSKVFIANQDLRKKLKSL